MLEALLLGPSPVEASFIAAEMPKKIENVSDC
jgi:hypothetical protein